MTPNYCVALTTTLLLIILSPGPALAEEVRPLKDLDVFELEYASDPQIAPGGDRIVYVRNSMSIMKDRRQGRLWIVAADGSGHRKLTVGESQESSPRWSPDGASLAYVADSDEGSEIFVRWMDSGQTARLTQLPKSPSGISWSPDGRWLAFSMLVSEDPPELAKGPKKPEDADWAEKPRVITRVRHEADGQGYLEPGYHHLFVLPADGGTVRQVTSGDFHHRDAPQWTPDGEFLVFSANRGPDWEYEFRNSEIYGLALADGKLRELTDRDGPDRDPAISPDGEWIAYVGFDDRVRTYQVTHLYVMRRDGSDKRAVTSDFDRSVSEPVWDAAGEKIYFRYTDRGNSKIGATTLAGEVETLTGDLGGTSLGRPYGGGSFSVSAAGAVAYTLTRPEHPADVAVRLPEGGVLRATELNRDVLGERTLGEIEELWFESAADRRPIQAWIVKPPGFAAGEEYPLILEIHGGPIADYGDRFAAEIQLYAAAGYVVLYVNPRGSTGYGEEFGDLLYHDYPGQDYDDLMSAVNAVIARGYVDAKRLFVTGGSAGGIMTAWIVGKTDRFRAAVVAKPVINWYSKVLVADNYYYYYNYRYPGLPWENPETYLKYSPISLVGNVETPSMVLVGGDDLRTPLSEAKQFYHALKLRKIDTALVQFPGASHDIAARPSQLIGKVAHVLAWFERYSDSEPATAE